VVYSEEGQASLRKVGSFPLTAAAVAGMLDRIKPWVDLREDDDLGPPPVDLTNLTTLHASLGAVAGMCVLAVCAAMFMFTCLAPRMRRRVTRLENAIKVGRCRLTPG